MAEFLIYNKTHWLDLPSKSNPSMTGYERNHIMIDTDYKLSTLEKIEKKDVLTRKFNRRYQPKDIVEVREDGKPRGKLEPETFLFLQIPMILKQAKIYMEPLKVDGSTTRRRKYWIDISGIVFDENKTASLSHNEFNSRIRTK